jgi:hypothetical protein
LLIRFLFILNLISFLEGVMKKRIAVMSVIFIVFYGGGTAFAQYHDYLALDRFVADPLYSDFLSRGDFHAGIHSGSWTLKREQILESESKEKYRSCRDPYCKRCSKHLSDYGHEYQYINGVSQRQLWYRGTAGSIAHVRQFGYDEHGFPYAHRGQPAAVMSWEYARTLNHALWEQVQARNAVADEEAAEHRVGLLSELRDAALSQLAQSRAAWEQIQHSGHCLRYGRDDGNPSPCFPRSRFNKQLPAQPIGNIAVPPLRTVAHSQRPPFWGLCEYCGAKAQFRFDQTYVAEVEAELAGAVRELELREAIANEAVRIALLSKTDADKATRFKRIQMKPPKYQEVLAEKENAEKNKTKNEKKE